MSPDKKDANQDTANKNSFDYSYSNDAAKILISEDLGQAQVQPKTPIKVKGLNKRLIFVIVASLFTVFLVVGLIAYYATVKNAPDDEEKLELVESSSYEVPDGFYVEKYKSGSVKYYEAGPNNFYCAKNYDDAFSTISQYIENYNKENERYEERLVEPSGAETDKYYEFKVGQIDKREDQNNDSSKYPHRIIKCEYISDLNYGRYDKALFNGTTESSTSEYAGVFAKKPISKDTVLDLVGFLWSIKNNNTAGIKILKVSTLESEDSINITIVETETTFGDWDLSDTVHVYESEYKVNNDSGIINYSKEQLSDIRE